MPSKGRWRVSSMTEAGCVPSTCAEIRCMSSSCAANL
ncbi:MAG: hypothetical protein ACLQIQ_02345 [Beijerinckiaceae bacterium]